VWLAQPPAAARRGYPYTLQREARLPAGAVQSPSRKQSWLLHTPPPTWYASLLGVEARSTKWARSTARIARSTEPVLIRPCGEQAGGSSGAPAAGARGAWGAGGRTPS
jgi:hypothetical protein